MAVRNRKILPLSGCDNQRAVPQAMHVVLFALFLAPHFAHLFSSTCAISLTSSELGRSAFRQLILYLANVCAVASDELFQTFGKLVPWTIR